MNWWTELTRNLKYYYKGPKSKYLSGNLSLLYAFIGWNALAIIFYHSIKTARKELTEEEKQGLSPGQKYALEMGRKDAKIIRFKGFTIEEIETRPSEEANTKM